LLCRPLAADVDQLVLLLSRLVIAQTTMYRSATFDRFR
jgi:hypothetical protein